MNPEDRAKAPLSRGRMIGFMLYRFFVSSWIRRRTRSQATLGVVLPVLGVAIGVASFMIVLSIMGGFVGNLKARLLGVEPHAEVVRSDGFGLLESAPELIERLVSHPLVAGASPFQTGDVILQSDARPVTAVVTGIDPERASVFHRFDGYLTGGGALEGLGKDLLTQNGEGPFPAVVLGSGVARALGVWKGDRVTFVSTIPEDGPFGMAPRQTPAVVMDVLETGSARYDAKMVFTTLSFANDFFDLPEDQSWAGVQLLLQDASVEGMENAASILQPLVESYHARVRTWAEANGALLRALQLERWGMSFVLYMVILVGCFTITITLVLSVKRKARELAILRAVGFERSELGLIYLLQGTLIGSVGVALGLGAGLGILELLTNSQLPLVSVAYNGRLFPVLINWSDVARVALGSVFLSGLASVWPAWEVLRINVVETLSDRG
jgi:lipoprotein-releasing system permease protein